jgi:nucleotide-binding universal stress UspA family protein
MATWNRICCAVDFSAPSRAALLQAAELARRLDCQLTLAHVHHPRTRPGRNLTSVSKELEMAAEELRRKLDQLRSEAERVAQRSVLTAVLSGNPATEILQFVRTTRMDALVIGTHGRRGMSRLLPTSVAERVAREAPCPVVLVRSGGDEDVARTHVN